MSGVDVESILKQVEALLARAGALPVEAVEAVEKPLNVVEALSADKNELAEEVRRLRKQLEQKKKDKTTANSQPAADQAAAQDANHSSEQQRRQRDQKRRATRDRRSFKDVPIHEEVECPVEPQRGKSPLETARPTEIGPNDVGYLTSALAGHTITQTSRAFGARFLFSSSK